LFSNENRTATLHSGIPALWLYCLQCFQRYLSAKLQKLFVFEETMKKKRGKTWKKTEKSPPSCLPHAAMPRIMPE